MNKYLSLVFLYNRASCRRILLVTAAIPLSLLIVFLLRVGNPYEADSYMLMEHGFGGIGAVLIFVAVNLMGLIAVVNSLNGKKELKATHATMGYTMRRLRITPFLAYITIFTYYLAIVIILWSVAVVSIFAIGRVGLAMAGADAIEMKLALGVLRTEIGHILIPISHPVVIAFNIVSMLALAGECARSCYLTWHNGRQSAGVAMIIVPMFLVWIYDPVNSYVLIALLVIACYAAISFCFL